VIVANAGPPETNARAPETSAGWPRDLTGTVALVTGAAERVGAAIALALSRAGASVVINHLGMPSQATALVSAIERDRGAAIAIEADISSAEQSRRLVEDAVAAFGRLDFVVHNASSFVRRPFLSLSEADFERSFGVLVRGPLFLSQAAAGVMTQQGSGKIIAIAGNSLYEAWPEYVGHALAKCTLARMMELLAVALSPHVQCLVLAPDRVLGADEPAGAARPAAAGGVHTARGEATGDGLVTMPDGTRFRAGDPDEVASAVVWLCQSGRYLNGAVVPLDGGKSRY
jgi:NAD(P)-dependent dehydrogenase (short-subunit alcohol dehydrogenase family)